MRVKSLSRITVQLLVAGRSPETSAAQIRQETTEKQTTLTGTLAKITHKAHAAKLEPPIVAVVGYVVTLSDRPQWFAAPSPTPERCLRSLAILLSSLV